jgi:NAD(P)-dependent dehydrogenase (short-subunit alcohol dehydrogenase family)
MASEFGHPADLFDLSGQVAVVTGGSRGIGRALATAFARAGSDVVIASRKFEKCAEIAAAIHAETGRRAVPLACHVGRWADCDRLVHQVYATLGRCDVLVNNAGMSPQYDALTDITEEYYDKVSAVNLKGPFRLGVLFGQRMSQGEGGSIINISSTASQRVASTELVYACAKAGLNALTLGLASAYGPTVRSNAILPGAVLTDIADSWTDAYREMAASLSPLGRSGEPEDFIGAALWLASRSSSWVTGTLVRVDGGAASHNA